MPKFEDNPILNSPYSMPERHWELDGGGKPTGKIQAGRRISSYLVPIPKAGGEDVQGALLQDKSEENFTVNSIRTLVDEWRVLPPEKWNVSFCTRRLLEHWREEGGVSPRLFFCQREAAETLIWLNEVAPQTQKGKAIVEDIRRANKEANPDLFRFAAKMATGSGKTTVMAMMIAYHTLNKAHSPRSTRFADHFLVIAPGITIKDRLRVLLPQDSENYYEKRRIVPPDMMGRMNRAHVAVVNFQALKLREKISLAKTPREVLTGNDTAPDTKESEGQMLARVCRELLRADRVAVINDEAHHCFRRKTESAAEDEEADASPEEKEEIRRGREEARLWISGIEALARKTPLCAVYDLSATPFFLKGAGYPEGHLFRWVVSDFSLMDAMESGVVKLPRVPVDDATITENRLPIYRDLYRHIKDRLPRKGSQKNLNPADLPPQLTGALQAMYSQYEKVHNEWRDSGADVPPVFIVICNNTSVSKLIYDYVSGYPRDGGFERGAFDLFNNLHKDTGKPLARPKTFLIDSTRLESGEGLTDEFKRAAAAEIEVFKGEMRRRNPERGADKITDEELLREVMNTVGKKDKLGEQIRCVVSVSMLTEGWDASNVTHIVGVRAFGTQLICEQAVGRALRRISYEADDEGMLSPEYADICGVPFNFVPGVKANATKPPDPPTRVRHLDERAALAISYPRIVGYKIRPPEDRLTADFDENSRLTLETEDAPPKAKMHGIIGEKIMLDLDDLKKRRENETVFFVAAYNTRIKNVVVNIG